MAPDRCGWNGGDCSVERCLQFSGEVCSGRGGCKRMETVMVVERSSLRGMVLVMTTTSSGLVGRQDQISECSG